MSILAQVMPRAHDIRTADWLKFAASLGIDAARRHENELARTIVTQQHSMQYPSGDAAHLLCALYHGGQRNSPKQLRHRLVVDSHDSCLLGHGHACYDAG